MFPTLSTYTPGLYAFRMNWELILIVCPPSDVGHFVNCPNGQSSSLASTIIRTTSCIFDLAFQPKTSLALAG